MTIDNNEEYDAAQGLVDDAHALAMEFWTERYGAKYPAPKRGERLYNHPRPDFRWAWEMACKAALILLERDPEEAVDALHDALRDQPDPCDADRAARLDAA